MQADAEQISRIIGGMQAAAFLLLLCAAAFLDLKSRVIPDAISVSIALLSLWSVEPLKLAGIFAAVPFLAAGLAVGGIGGGDIKLTGACGMVVGFWDGLWGAMAGLLFLVLFHNAVTLYRRIRKQPMQGCRGYAYPFAPFLLLGMGCILLSGGTIGR